MKKILLKIASWFWKKPQRTTQDEINFDLELFNIRFCKNCGVPFHLVYEYTKYCSKGCRIRFNNKKRYKRNG
jgi:hypothetical protein